MLVQVFEKVDARPGPSSQSTAGCLSVALPVGEDYLIVDLPSLHANMPPIQPSTKRPWDEAVGRVLRERAEAWKRLAEL